MQPLTTGFLPAKDPLRALPKAFAAWENIAQQLPKNLLRDDFLSALNMLPEFPLHALKTMAEQERAMCVLSFLGHAGVWHTAGTDRLPAIIAKPWYAVSQRLGRPPVLSYASYALNNWYRLDSAGPIELGNIALIQNFWGGVDEEWFVLIHVDIEQKAAEAIRHMPALQDAAKDKNWPVLIALLRMMVASLQDMCAVLSRMPEYCDPYIYYQRVRPYIHGWKNNPALPEGLIYEGVSAYEQKGQFFCGETGAQSSIIPCFDAVLGIFHDDDPLKAHLNEMRDYMPPEHRDFLQQREAMPSVSRVISEHDCPADCHDLLKEAIAGVASFRDIHLGYAKAYVAKQHEQSKANSTQVGTGGTPFVPYLSKHLNETIDASQRGGA